MIKFPCSGNGLKLRFPEDSRLLQSYVSSDHPLTPYEWSNEGMENLQEAMSYLSMLVDRKTVTGPRSILIENIDPATQPCGRIWLGSDCFIAWIGSSRIVRLFIIDPRRWELAIFKTFSLPPSALEEAALDANRYSNNDA